MAQHGENTGKATPHASFASNDRNRPGLEIGGHGGLALSLPITAGPENDSKETLNDFAANAMFVSQCLSIDDEGGFAAGILDGDPGNSLDLGDLIDQFIAAGEEFDECMVYLVDAVSKFLEFWRDGVMRVGHTFIVGPTRLGSPFSALGCTILAFLRRHWLQEWVSACFNKDQHMTSQTLEHVGTRSTFVQEFMHGLAERNSGESEFLQAVEECVVSLEPVLDRHANYRDLGILHRMVEPDRIIQFRVTWMDDAGEVQVNRGVPCAVQ